MAGLFDKVATVLLELFSGYLYADSHLAVGYRCIGLGFFLEEASLLHGERVIADMDRSFSNVPDGVSFLVEEAVLAVGCTQYPDSSKTQIVQVGSPCNLPPRPLLSRDVDSVLPR